jgi:hypothetical protein
MAAIVRESVVTCPGCGHRESVAMPEDACLYFHDCPGSGTTLRPLAGDCCVFCSYGSMPCPSMQRRRARNRAMR